MRSYFRYGAMNSGKSTALLQAAFNYEERGHQVLLAKPAVDTKGDRSIVSRLGMVRDSTSRSSPMPKSSTDSRATVPGSSRSTAAT